MYLQFHFDVSICQSLVDITWLCSFFSFLTYLALPNIFWCSTFRRTRKCSIHKRAIYRRLPLRKKYDSSLALPLLYILSIWPSLRFPYTSKISFIGVAELLSTAIHTPASKLKQSPELPSPGLCDFLEANHTPFDYRNGLIILIIHSSSTELRTDHPLKGLRDR